MGSSLGVMVLAHAREQLLPLICRQIQTAWPDSVIQIAVDRPTPAVRDILRLPLGAQVLEVPFPVVADREYFMEARRWQLDQLRPYAPRYAVLWDDDHILEDTAEPARLMADGADLIYADKAYIWDDLAHINVHIPRHRSVFFFKLRDGDQYPLDRFIHAPAGIHDDPCATSVVLRARLLDIGYMYSRERERLFKAYARAGKIDDVTKALVEPPTKERLISRGPWFAALKKELKGVPIS